MSSACSNSEFCFRNCPVHADGGGANHVAPNLNLPVYWVAEWGWGRRGCPHRTPREGDGGPSWAQPHDS